MSKKTFQLISGIVGGVQAIAVAVVTYTSPEFALMVLSLSSALPSSRHVASL